MPTGVQLLYKLAQEQPHSYWFNASHTTDKDFKADPILSQPRNEFVKVVPPSL